jgi:hypothetical protein
MKQIAPGSHSSGKFGDFLSSNNGKHQKQARELGNVLEAIATNNYWVLFDTNTTVECFSNSLCVKGAPSSTPPPTFEVCSYQPWPLVYKTSSFLMAVHPFSMGSQKM